ncbi:putative baseplate assembly protein [Sorangium sp. So ce131]|uniref:putative baseplate assembly protein n=1 Tax=Sorangium sp. So ce131 TaxID=3133282 RepID=UPI003F61CE66
MELDALSCRVDERRKRLFGNADWNGIDFLDVSDDQRSLCVHFFGKPPENVTTSNVRIEGGRRIRDVRAVSVEIDRSHDPERDDCLRITLDRAGDFSVYRLCLVERVDPAQRGEGEGGSGEEAPWRPLSGIDPRYACIDFSFKIDCPSELDCKTKPPCPPPVRPAPEINYLAKDYASFRQLMFDRLALTLPDWQERHAPDLGVTLVEILAYVADHLSYYQDAVATEAYLDTARLRTSVRRHVRLVDYAMHEGSNARAFITVWTSTDLAPLRAKDFYFITGFRGITPVSGGVVDEASLELVPRDRYEVFEPLVADPEEELTFRAAHSEIRFYTWGDHECCLPAGARRATLLDDARADEAEAPGADEVSEAGLKAPGTARVLDLRVGDVLIFEEIVGPRTGNPADADPTHRHPVRLTRVTPGVDGLLGRRILEIEWGEEDALPFPLCLSSRLPTPDCRRIGDVSVARGNVVLVDHGRTLGEPLGPVEFVEKFEQCACDGAVISASRAPARFAPRLSRGPLTFAEPLPGTGPAAHLLTQDVRRSSPQISLTEQVGDEGTASGPAWSPRRDLLASGADDRHFVVETDDAGNADLRFGDGELGRAPDGGSRFRAAYRVGNGPSGNVGRDSIRFLVPRKIKLSADRIEPRNPLPARGGTAPEPTDEVKLIAPRAFRSRLERAITAEDYVELAQRSAKVHRAAAELRWTGSWYEARVAVDPLHATEADARLLGEIEANLLRYRRMGHDLAVVPARLVPLALAMDICVLPSFDRGHVKAEVLKVLSNRPLAGGKLGFFHPDNLSFGEPLRLSRLVAAVKAVGGVENVKVTELRRFGEPQGREIEDGILPIGPMEVAQLDDDPSLPENGSIRLTMRGGR